MLMKQRLKPDNRLAKYCQFYNENGKYQTLKAKPAQVYYKSIKLPETG